MPTILQRYCASVPPIDQFAGAVMPETREGRHRDPRRNPPARRAIGARIVQADRRRSRRPLNTSLRGRPAREGTSIGVALLDDPRAFGQAVLVKAHLAIYEVKLAGRNSWSFSAPARSQQPPD